MRAKNVGKKNPLKIANTSFLYSHEYRGQKMGGKNARNSFSRNTRIVRTKKCWEKNRLKKSGKTRFLYSH